MQAEHGDIFHSIQSGNIPGVKEFLDAGVPVNLTDEEGWSLLHHAAACGQVEVIHLLQENGCCVDTVDVNGRTALHYAAANGFVESVRALIEMGSDVNALDNEHTTPLQWAVMSEQYAVMEALIEHGGSVDGDEAEPLIISVDLDLKPVSCHREQAGLAVHNAPKNHISSLKDDSQVQFFKAAQSGDTAAVTECLDLGVPVDLTDEDGWSPVHHAIAHGQVEVIRLLMDRGCCMSPVKSRIPPSSDYAGVHNSRKCDIFDAARSGDTAKVKEYLKLGVSVDVTDEDGRTPLHCAAGEGQVDAVKLLIDKGCCIDPVDNNGWTPSIFATMQGQDEVERLLKLAKLVHDSTGWTPLHAAVADGQLEFIEMLLSVGGRKLMTVVDGEERTPLHHAVTGGHKDVVTLLLKEGCPVTTQDGNGVSILHVAAQFGQEELIERLIDCGLDANIEDKDGATPLHYAVYQGHLESVRALLRLGGRRAMTMIAGDAGTPLHVAVNRGNKDIVLLLLSEGCPMNMTIDGDLTALHIAAATGQVDMIEMLVDYGLDVNILDDRGRTPLHSAACENQLESARTLIGLGGRRSMTVTADELGTPLNQAVVGGHKDMVSLLLKEGDGDDYTALLIAAQCGQVGIIGMLVNHGLDVNVANNEGWTPLHSAAVYGQLESVCTLLRLGGRKSLEKTAKKGGTPLHQAVAGGHKDVVTLLLKEGCPVATRANNGASVLHFAAQFGQEEIIAYLIDCGLDVNIEDDDGRTPLHWAACHGQLESVHTLLRLGGRRAMTMIAGDAGTPLHVAVRRGNKDIVSQLLSEGCPIKMTINGDLTALHIAAGNGQVDIIEMLVDNGLDVSIEDDRGRTPLHSAACENQLESARTLIRLGGERIMAVTGDELGTPLHQAAAEGHKDMVSFLLKEGCPTTVTDDNGMSAAHVTAMFGKVDIIETLVKHGLDVNLVDNEGISPLHSAASHGHLESVCTLLRLGGKASMSMVAGHSGTPLHQAVGNGYNEIVTQLLDEGCPVNVTTTNGLTALHAAANFGKVDVVDMLVDRGCDINAVDEWGATPLFYGIAHIELMKRLVLSGVRISHHDNFGMNSFEHFIASARVSSHRLKSLVEASGIACDGRNFVNVISTLSKNDLLDINRVLCLAAVSGHVDLFDDIVDSDLPLDQQRMPKLVQALCIRLESWGVIQKLLEELHILDDPLNPLQLSLISCKQLGPGAQSTAQHKFAERVISHPRTKSTIRELFPNGLSPLDIARQFELHDIAGMIERAGGRPGMWADRPKEIRLEIMKVLRSLKRVRGSEFGEDHIRTLLMMCGYVIKGEEGSKAAQNAVLEETPEQPDVEECVLSNVKELRKWRRVGELLKVAAPVLDKLAKVADDNDDAYYSMLRYWLEHGHSVTWKALLDAIGHFETKKTMDDIRKKIERGLSVTNTPTSDTMLPSPSYDISYVKVTSETASFSLVPPGGTQRSKARKAGDANTLTVDKLFRIFGRKMCAQWKEFAVHLRVDLNTRRLISQKCQNFGEDCFKELVRRWLRSGDGTGDLPRTWETVLQALKLTGFPLLVEDVREVLSKECSGGEPVNL